MYTITEERKLTVAVVGAGYWGPNLMRNIAANPKAELTAICDSDPAALKRMAAKYPNIAMFTSLEKMLDQEDLDAVMIATPSGLHRTIEACLAMGYCY